MTGVHFHLQSGNGLEILFFAALAESQKPTIAGACQSEQEFFLAEKVGGAGRGGSEG